MRTDSPDHALSLSLIEAQYALRDRARHADGAANQAGAVAVLVSGVELAGKGDSLTRLRGWSDPRLLQVVARLQPPRADVPLWQPHVAHLPARGELVVLFSNWVSDLITLALDPRQPWKKKQVKAQIALLHRFEQQVQAEGTVLVKCWFDLSWSTLQQRLNALEPSLHRWQRLHGLDWHRRKALQRLKKLRHWLGAGWIDIDSNVPTKRDRQFAKVVLAGLQAALHPPVASAAPPIKPPAPLHPALVNPTQAQRSRADLDREGYRTALHHLQHRFAKRLRQHQARGRRLVVVFEGMDAAGKGGAIRRLVTPLDPRECQIHSIAAPNAFEQRHDYLWRFRTRMPEPQPQGTGLVIFDRSWYGRVLVERVEGLIAPEVWRRAYAEINDFEQDLHHHGTDVIKIWLAIDKAEQARRFRARKATPHKRFKITAEDWRNRRRWDAYLQAASDMLAQTDQPAAHWHVVATNDKRRARLAVLDAVCGTLEAIGHDK